MKKISLHQMQAMLEHDDVYGVYEIYYLSIQTEVKKMSPEIAVPCQDELENLLLQFDSLFQVPTTLPPHCLIDHRIHLLPETKPVNVQPYHYPHYKKGEIEKLVNEMLNQGRRVEMDPMKVIAVHDCPEPTTQRQVRGFLGLAGYYRCFIKGYATMAAPLTKLLRKDAFRWDDQETTTFWELKQQLSTTPILSLPDFTQEFFVKADASDYGIGAVLL
ncbi:ty3-gypsy retrotransposon protein [Tanacetum coccineum]|uniref:Ty3-gypsy retrotransposon protein n=1 Tax=Tanacetum coccineum TaxID=301880 RepID=A0ABQ5A8X8_9ASTR